MQGSLNCARLYCILTLIPPSVSLTTPPPWDSWEDLFGHTTIPRIIYDTWEDIYGHTSTTQAPTTIPPPTTTPRIIYDTWEDIFGRTSTTHAPTTIPPPTTTPKIIRDTWEDIYGHTTTHAPTTITSATREVSDTVTDLSAISVPSLGDATPVGTGGGVAPELSLYLIFTTATLSWLRRPLHIV